MFSSTPLLDPIHPMAVAAPPSSALTRRPSLVRGLRASGEGTCHPRRSGRARPVGGGGHARRGAVLARASKGGPVPAAEAVKMAEVNRVAKRKVRARLATNPSSDTDG